MAKDTKNKDIKALDDAKMDKVSGGWKAGENPYIDTSDQRFDYTIKATNRNTGEVYENDGTGWKSGATSTQQNGGQWSPYGNNAGQWSPYK